MAKQQGPPPDYVEVNERHGTQAQYRRGCRCDRCRKAHTDDERERRHRKSGPPAVRSSFERFWAKVCETEGCWLWTASLDSSGYGLFRESGRDGQGTPLVLHEAVTGQENTARRRQTHCIRGHEFTEENTHWVSTCRACWTSRKEEKR